MSDLTPARVGLGRTGVSLPTLHMLAMAADHALARDAVHAPFDADALQEDLATRGITSMVVTTRAHDRAEYLRHPGAGRMLSDLSRDDLMRRADDWDVALLVSDGLSATAAVRHAADLVEALLSHLPGLRVAPVVIASLGRVGLLNDAGAALGARCAAIILGERPGLSAPDGLSLYFEVGPRPGLTDADRNCISNIRPGGLPLEQAAISAATLIQAGLRDGISGVGLKVEYEDLRAIPAPNPE